MKWISIWFIGQQYPEAEPKSTSKLIKNKQERISRISDSPCRDDVLQNFIVHLLLLYRISLSIMCTVGLVHFNSFTIFKRTDRKSALSAQLCLTRRWNFHKIIHSKHFETFPIIIDRVRHRRNSLQNKSDSETASRFLGPSFYPKA